MKAVISVAVMAIALPSYVFGQTTGTYTAYGSGCGVTGTKCGGHDPKSPGKLLRQTTLPNEYAYPFTLATTRPVTGARFWCRSANSMSNTVIARLYKATSTGAPDAANPLAQTLMTIGTKEQFWQCSWDKVQVLMKGDYFVAYEPWLPGTSTAVVLTSQMTDGTVRTTNRAYWRRANLNFAATGIVTHPWFEILCAGSAAPKLTNTGVPTVNKSFSIDLSQASSGLAIGILGFKKVAADLTAVAPGCYLFATPDLLIPTSVANGKASITLAIPNNNKLIGAQFYNQFIRLQPRANALNMLFSNAGEGKVGG